MKPDGEKFDLKFCIKWVVVLFVMIRGAEKNPQVHTLAITVIALLSKILGARRANVVKSL